MDVSKNSGTPKSSILIGFSIVNHPFWGTPMLGNHHIRVYVFEDSETEVPHTASMNRKQNDSGTDRQKGNLLLKMAIFGAKYYPPGN